MIFANGSLSLGVTNYIYLVLCYVVVALTEMLENVFPHSPMFFRLLSIVGGQLDSQKANLSQNTIMAITTKKQYNIMLVASVIISQNKSSRQVVNYSLV